jgi:hypothetical protein
MKHYLIITLLALFALSACDKGPNCTAYYFRATWYEYGVRNTNHYIYHMKQPLSDEDLRCLFVRDSTDAANIHPELDTFELRFIRPCDMVGISHVPDYKCE